MNAEIEITFGTMARADIGLAAQDWQIESGTTGQLLLPEKDWLVVTVEGNERVVGPLWKGTVEFQFQSRVLTDPPDPKRHKAVVEATLDWLEKPLADLTAKFNALCPACTLNGRFVSVARPPQQQGNRWVSIVGVVCGFTRI